MQRSIKLSLLGVLSALIAVCCYAATTDDVVKTPTAPISITIEEDGAATGVNTKPEVEKLYEERKNVLETNIKTAREKAKTPEQRELITLANDSVECMQKSVEGFPLLINVIDGQKMKAESIAKVMEDNCVEDVLVHVKRDLPEKLDAAEETFKEIGFNIPDIEDF